MNQNTTPRMNGGVQNNLHQPFDRRARSTLNLATDDMARFGSFAGKTQLMIENNLRNSMRKHSTSPSRPILPIKNQVANNEEINVNNQLDSELEDKLSQMSSDLSME